MGAMKPDQGFNLGVPVKLRSMEIGWYKGETLLTPTVYAFTADFNFLIGKNLTFQAKVPYQYVRGSFGKNDGIGDLSISFTKPIVDKDKYDISLTLGAKIATGDATASIVSPSTGVETQLPMYYQVTLGSHDLVIGASYISREWLIAVGYQQPLSHQNENQFTPDPNDWDWYPDINYVRSYDLATDLRRGADVMFRAERNWRFANYNFNFGVLPIYRITHDQILVNGVYEKQDKTTGLALSILAGAGYQFNVSNAVKIIYGLKITDRDVNPDGLTRDSVLTLAYQVKF